MPEGSSGTTPKSPNTRGKVLFLNSLEEVTLKGKFVPYLASFSNLIHLLELSCVSLEEGIHGVLPHSRGN